MNKIHNVCYTAVIHFKEGFNNKLYNNIIITSSSMEFLSYLLWPSFFNSVLSSVVYSWW